MGGHQAAAAGGIHTESGPSEAKGVGYAARHYREGGGCSSVCREHLRGKDGGSLVVGFHIDFNRHTKQIDKKQAAPLVLLEELKICHSRIYAR
jgi:hypothetical protein